MINSPEWNTDEYQDPQTDVPSALSRRAADRLDEGVNSCSHLYSRHAFLPSSVSWWLLTAKIANAPSFWSDHRFSSRVGWKKGAEIMFRHFPLCFCGAVPTLMDGEGRREAQRSSPQTRSAWKVTDAESSSAAALQPSPRFLRTQARVTATLAPAQFKSPQRHKLLHGWSYGQTRIYFSQLKAHGRTAELECLSVAHRAKTSWRHTWWCDTTNPDAAQHERGRKHTHITFMQPFLFPACVHWIPCSQISH